MMAGMYGSVLQRILKRLDGAGVRYRRLEHHPTRTSEESARARGAPLRIGGKSLVLRHPEGFALFVLSAALELDSRAVRGHFGTRRLRFATRDELRNLTGLVPGCVPPFGRPVLPLDVYADPSVLHNEEIAFNAGVSTQSIIMSTVDWQRLVAPRVFPFSKPRGLSPA
jgi:Ala-tRNA(Pro) deacylase